MCFNELCGQRWGPRFPSFIETASHTYKSPYDLLQMILYEHRQAADFL